MKRSIPIRAEGTGYAAEGRNFYVWDPDPREVERTARELLRGNPVGAARRVVVGPLESNRSAGADSEALDF